MRNCSFLFKLLGRQVYTSNVQLGGPSIMHNNGKLNLRIHFIRGGGGRVKRKSEKFTAEILPSSC